MSKTFQLEVVAPDKVVYRGMVKSISAAGTEGSFGVLAGHAPFITELQTNILTVVDAENKTLRFALDGGFLEVIANKAILLADCSVKEGEVDVEKARLEKAEAEKAVLQGGSAAEKEKARASLKRADTWLKLANVH